ncbi:mitochondrial phosphate carrier protein 2 [Geopyxis carbonaria]|nr:mitochondrial phosphate carrier protein 2 [Geopyxis carbonaria]
MQHPPPSTLAAAFPIASMSDKARALSKEAQAELKAAAGKAGGGGIEMYSGKYYAACILGGLLACGTTHTAVTPLDLVKCRRQVNASLYSSNIQGWKTIYQSSGIRGVFTGWSPTFVGYSAQGAFKYGGYEFFKKFYSDLAGPEKATQYKTLIYLAGSASAEFIADIALCPFEAVKVRMQTTQPVPWGGSTLKGIAAALQAEGVAGLYKGIGPLWGRQIPYTMMKFASFETIVEMMYARLPKPKSAYGRDVQTAVSFGAGYLAGILCAIVSHPADVMVSKLNTSREKGEGMGKALGRIYGDIGFRGLWSGLPVRIVMIGTLTGAQWLIYDSFKMAVGLPTTGGGEEAKK